jgi:hypothetical protein
MPQIEIDFEVFKTLTNLRESEDVTYNDVVRELLKLPAGKAVTKQVKDAAKPWVVSGTSFPSGTEFIAEYKGNQHAGVVKDGRLVLSDGHAFTTPSSAAGHVTGNNVNGWRFWKCKLPNALGFVLMERLRGKVY